MQCSAGFCSLFPCLSAFAVLDHVTASATTFAPATSSPRASIVVYRTRYFEPSFLRLDLLPGRLGRFTPLYLEGSPLVSTLPVIGPNVDFRLPARDLFSSSMHRHNSSFFTWCRLFNFPSCSPLRLPMFTIGRSNLYEWNTLLRVFWNFANQIGGFVSFI